MTREEAIKVINNHLEHWKRLVRGKVCDENEGAETISAFEVAIKALSQEQDMTIAYLMGKYEDKEPCDDAISREDAIKALQNVVCESMAIKSRMVGAIEELPSVTQKSGEWLTNEIIHDGCKYTVTYCSECDEQADYRTPFCPECGAKMESEDKE